MLDAVTPAAHTTVRAGDPLRRRPVTLTGIDARDGAAGEDGDAELLERALRLRGQRRRERRQHAVGRLDEQDARRARIDRAGSRAAACRCASSPICPAISTPVGPAPTTTNVSHAARCVVVLLLLGGLERGEDPAAHDERALERLHLGGVRAPVVVPEVRVTRAARDDERVVRQRLRRRYSVHRAQLQLARVEVEVGDLGEHDAHVAVAREDRAQRIRDLARRERAGRHLVGQRLEQVEVAPVDERDVDVCSAQAERRL